MMTEIKVDKTKLLETLNENLVKHKQIVVEAKAGYIEKAKDLLNQRLKQLKSGEYVNLHFDLNQPQDHSKEYITAIAAATWDNRKELSLSQTEFKSYILDEWSWDSSFYLNNAAFSSTAVSGCLSKGLL